MDHEEVRTMALSLPDAVEEPHFDSASFRVRGHIFLTLPTGEAGEEHAHVFLGEHEVHLAVTEQPGTCEELWWGKKLSGVRVRLDGADPAYFQQMVVDAWRAKAPKRLAATLDESELLARGPRRRPGAH